jgi:hypothetical protein
LGLLLLAASNRLFRRLSTSTTPHSTTHKTTAANISLGFGEKIRTKPLPFTSAEKLDTQKGIKNNRNVCQKSNFTLFTLAAVVLMNNANPIIKLNPHEVSQSLGAGSKYRASTTLYQMK